MNACFEEMISRNDSTIRNIIGIVKAMFVLSMGKHWIMQPWRYLQYYTTKDKWCLYAKHFSMVSQSSKGELLNYQYITDGCVLQSYLSKAIDLKYRKEITKSELVIIS